MTGKVLRTRFHAPQVPTVLFAFGQSAGLSLLAHTLLRDIPQTLRGRRNPQVVVPLALCRGPVFLLDSALKFAYTPSLLFLVFLGAVRLINGNYESFNNFSNGQSRNR